MRFLINVGSGNRTKTKVEKRIECHQSLSALSEPSVREQHGLGGHRPRWCGALADLHNQPSPQIRVRSRGTADHLACSNSSHGGWGNCVFASQHYAA